MRERQQQKEVWGKSTQCSYTEVQGQRVYQTRTMGTAVTMYRKGQAESSDREEDIFKKPFLQNIAVLCFSFDSQQCFSSSHSGTAPSHSQRKLRWNRTFLNLLGEAVWRGNPHSVDLADRGAAVWASCWLKDNSWERGVGPLWLDSRRTSLQGPPHGLIGENLQKMYHFHVLTDKAAWEQSSLGQAS